MQEIHKHIVKKMNQIHKYIKKKSQVEATQPLLG